MEAVKTNNVGMADPETLGIHPLSQNQIKRLAKDLSEKAKHMTAEQIERAVREME